MPSLTQTAHVARQTIKFTGIGLVAYILLRAGVVYAWNLYLALNPPPPPAPTVGFGPLPKMVFPANPGYQYDFVLETPTGTFPAFPNQIQIYPMPYKRANLLALDQAKGLAKTLGFASEPTALSADTYEWQLSIPSPLMFTINIVDGSFDYTYQWQTDPELVTQKTFLSEGGVRQTADQFFNRANLEPTDINMGNGKLSYLKASGNRLIPAISLSEANFIRLDYFRNAIETYEMVTANPDEGIIHIVLSGTDNNLKEVVEVGYSYFPVDYQTIETYPLKPVVTAWDELKRGAGFMAKVPSDATRVTIRRVSLAYYDAHIAQPFLQPVYVFLGDDGTSREVVAYVPALDPTWVRQ